MEANCVPTLGTTQYNTIVCKEEKKRLNWLSGSDGTDSEGRTGRTGRKTKENWTRSLGGRLPERGAYLTYQLMYSMYSTDTPYSKKLELVVLVRKMKLLYKCFTTLRL